MGLLIGLLFGLGLLAVVSSLLPSRPAATSRRVGPSARDRLADQLVQAGVHGVTPQGFVAAVVALFVVVTVLVFVITLAWGIALAFGGFAAYAPVALVRMRQRRRSHDLRDLWPDVVDNLASSVRAGLSLPEALTQLGDRGPEPLRPAFTRFGEDYRATGSFGRCLDRLKVALADPVGDRIVESLRVAREVGGSDLGRLLRTLSGFLREDAHARSELETRQGWTVNAAKLAVAAPWIVLGLMATRPETVAAYNSVTGLAVLAVGGALCVIAYRLMIRLGRLPEERRVLR